MALTEEEIVAVPGLLSRWTRLASGAKAHFVTAGETGPAVVLLHGGMIGSSGTAGWRFMAPFLGANGFRVYCPDQPGFGLTEDYERAYSPDSAGHVDFLHEFVTALCLDEFHISGNSMGCADAVNYTTAHPERVISYALIAGSIGDIVDFYDLVSRDPRPPEERPTNTMRFDGTPESMRTMLETMALDPSKISDDVVNMRTASANRHRAFYESGAGRGLSPHARSNLDARLSTKGRFDELAIPGIYVYGQNDVLFPYDIVGYAQEDALPEVQFFYPEDTGHQGQTDQPEMFNQLFLEFFLDGTVSWETAQRAGISTRRPPNPALVREPTKAPSA